MSNKDRIRQISDFERIKFRETANWVDLIIEPGEQNLLIIEGPDEYVKRVTCEVHDGTLEVSLGGGLSAKMKDALTTSLTRMTVRYHLFAKNVKEIEVFGLIRLNVAAYGDSAPLIRQKRTITSPGTRSTRMIRPIFDVY